MRTILALLAMGFAATAHAQTTQVGDPNFDTRVETPALAAAHPRLLFDEAHFNVNKSTTTYKAFVDLMRNDGAAVEVNRAPFTARALAGQKVLVIAGAMSAADPDDPKAKQPAFTAEEIAALRDWVKAGGGLLLLSDHEPVAGAQAELIRAFGVTPSPDVVVDRDHHFASFYPTNVEATGANGLLTGHALACGIGKLVVFGGASLTLPADAIIVRVGPTAKTDAGGPIAGNAQAGAFRYGRGRVVMTGDMGMLSAQIFTEGGVSNPWGMNVPGVDNRQFVLNAVRWLATGRTGCKVAG